MESRDIRPTYWLLNCLRGTDQRKKLPKVNGSLGKNEGELAAANNFLTHK